MNHAKNLVTEYPEIAAEWHPTKNGKFTPEDFSYGSGKKVWWMDKLEHEWEAKISNRTINKRGCPYCTGRKVLVGFNDLVTTHPKLAKEWHPTKNKDLTPQQVTAACKKKIWWIDALGHEWDTYIYNRKKGHGCPYCSGLKVLAGYNDLGTTHPELVKEWHPTKNGNLTPRDVMAGSHKKAWWLCEKGHDWEAEIKSRSNNSGCPYCSNLKIWTGYNDLETTHPQIAKQWHPTKNGKLSPREIGAGSTQKIWWKCDRGHEWKVKVVSRTSLKTGCPECVASMGTSFPEQAIYYYINKVVNADNRNHEMGKEIDIYLPQFNIGIEHNGDYHHQDREKDQEKVNYFKEKGIRLILVYGGNNTSANGDVIEYNYNRYKHESLEWAIKKIFELLKIDVPEINIGLDEIEICSGYMDMIKRRNLATEYPELAKEWHPTKNINLKPEYVTHKSSQKVWWLGKCGHEWDAVIGARVRGNGCPYCSGKKVLPGFNDLATTHPKIAAEWHPTKNGKLTPRDVTYGAGKRVWWRCEKGHDWDVKVNSRTNKDSGCPYCSGRKVWVGFNDLATTHPEIAAEWHPTKNGNLTPQQVTYGSGKCVWWYSVDGKEWNARIFERTKKQ